MLRKDGIENPSSLSCQNFLSGETVNCKRYADNCVNQRTGDVSNDVYRASHNQRSLIPQEGEHILQNHCPIQSLKVEAFPNPFIQFGMILHQIRQLKGDSLGEGRDLF